MTTRSALLVSLLRVSLAACADRETTGGEAPEGYVAMSTVEVAAAMVDDGHGGRMALVLGDGEQAYLGLEQDVDAEVPDAHASALQPCGHVQTFWASVWVPHYAVICNRTGTCSTITAWFPEPVDCEVTCEGPSTYHCTAHHTNGSNHLVPTPTTVEDGYCEYACTPFSLCEGCVAF